MQDSLLQEYDSISQWKELLLQHLRNMKSAKKLLALEKKLLKEYSELEKKQQKQVREAKEKEEEAY